MRDIVRDNIDHYLGAHARTNWTADSGLYPVERELIIRHFPQAPARILDLGCGGGRTTIGLEALGYEIDALDLSPDLVEEARKRVTTARVHLMDARVLEFPDATFDAALFSFNGFDCVYPTRERERVFAEVHRVLKPGGMFYYSGHNGVAAWWPRPGDTAGKLFRRDRALLRAQRAEFGERHRYLAFPEGNTAQVLFAALPHVHLRDLRASSFEPVAVYGSRSYRRGPHVLANAIGSSPVAVAMRLARLTLGHPHLHYIARIPG